MVARCRGRVDRSLQREVQMRLKFWRKREDQARRAHDASIRRDENTQRQQAQIDSARNTPTQTNTGMTSGTSGI